MEVAPPSALNWSMSVAEHGAAGAGGRWNGTSSSASDEAAALPAHRSSSPAASECENADVENMPPQLRPSVAKSAGGKSLNKKSLVWVTDGGDEDDEVVAARNVSVQTATSSA